MKDALPELQALESWLGRARLHPRQTHKRFESDAEVVKLGAGRYLALTVDTVCEEIAFGLYRDPYTMGWVAAQAALSDLAAVGASPLGVLLAAQWGPKEDKAGVAKGLQAALASQKTHLLGGDSGSAPTTSLSVTATGTLARKPLSRVGIRPGDVICMTGPCGVGPGLGFELLLGQSDRVIREKDYRPRARLREGAKLSAFAHAAMDTSDGVAATLWTLASLNGIRFELEFDPRWFHPLATHFCRARGLPLTSLLYGEHGDFELVFAVAEKDLPKARQAVPGLRILGRARRQKTDTIIIRGAKPLPIDLGYAQRLQKLSAAELHTAFRGVLEYLGHARLP